MNRWLMFTAFAKGFEWPNLNFGGGTSKAKNDAGLRALQWGGRGKGKRKHQQGKPPKQGKKRRY